MYEVDERDQVVALADVPQSSVGAPSPCVLADERRVILAYYMQERLPIWKRSAAELAASEDSREDVALVRFNRCFAHMLGSPSDEAFAGHPLESRGLRPYGVFRIDQSSWIRKLEKMNSVHPSHHAEVFRGLQHLVFAFHDSTFECVCQGFDVRTTQGSMREVVPEMVKLLQGDSSQSV